MKRKFNIIVILLFVLSLSFLSAVKISRDITAQKNLSRSHSHIKGKNSCTNCHSKPGEADSAKCLSCHSEIKIRIKNGNGYHRDKGEDCSACHAEHSGPDADLTDLDESDFDHSETGYLLKGKHQKISQCRKCHSPSRVLPRKQTISYLLKDNKCKTCHEPPHPGIKSNCSECHSNDSWKIDPWNF